MSHPHRALHAVAGFRTDLPGGVATVHTIGEEWLAKNTDIGWHAHPVWEAYLQLDGTSWWQDRHGRHELPAGNGYLVAPGVEHRLERIGKARHHFQFAIIDLSQIFARPELSLAKAFTEAQRRIRFHSGEASAIAAAFTLATSVCLRSSRLHTEVITATSTLLATVLLDWAISPQAVHLAPEHPAVGEVRRRIKREPGRPWRLHDLVARTGMSPKHLCTIFGATVGVTPHQYLLSVRLERVRRALADTDLSITELAGEFGFSSSQHLSRMFAKRFGSSPRAFRAGVT